MIYLIGTSHIAKESLEKVEMNISGRKPDLVAVELDLARLQGLIHKKKGKIQLPLFQKVIVLLLQKMQDTLSKETGILPGQEMLDAVRHAKKADAQVALIDQKINVTISRLMKAMGFREKAKLMAYLVLGFLGLGASKVLPAEKGIDLNKIPEDEFIEYAMGYMESSFPSIYKVLVADRNWYMAHNLMKLSGKFETIVAVVGAGHVQGMKKLLEDEKIEVKVL
ncbi:MAG: TraB/GumN family protein [Candidatus Aenigmarchaeota archaeon]|nr:TraB/GumN family protein [Candidatus Aenigmarchaeota archaeon]